MRDMKIGHGRIQQISYSFIVNFQIGAFTKILDVCAL